MTDGEHYLVSVGNVHLDVTVKLRHECRCSDPEYCARVGGRVPANAETLTLDELAAVVRSMASAHVA